MSRDMGQIIDVTPASKGVPIGNPDGLYTFINESAYTIYYRLADKETMVGVDAVLVAAPIFAARLKAGQSRVVHGGAWEVCTATGLTATLEVVPGASVGGEGGVASGAGLVFSLVKIKQAVAGIIDLGVEAGEIVTCHKLWGTFNGQGTIEYISDNDGNGDGQVEISGDASMGAGGGVNDAGTVDRRLCPKAPEGKHLTLVSVTSAFNGYAIISKGPA